MPLDLKYAAPIPWQKTGAKLGTPVTIDIDALTVSGTYVEVLTGPDGKEVLDAAKTYTVQLRPEDLQAILAVVMPRAIEQGILVPAMPAAPAP